MVGKDLIMATLFGSGGGSSGSGGGEGGGSFVAGTFTLAEATSQYEFAQFDPNNYKTGTPNFIAIRRIDGFTEDGDYSWLILTSSHVQGTVFQVGLRNMPTGLSTGKYSDDSANGFMTANNGAIFIGGNSKDYVLKANSFGYSMQVGTYAYVFGDLY